MGDIHWELTLCLLIAWILLYVTIRKSVRWSGNFIFFLIVQKTFFAKRYSFKFIRESSLLDSYSSVSPVVSINC